MPCKVLKSVSFQTNRKFSVLKSLQNYDILTAYIILVILKGESDWYERLHKSDREQPDRG